VCIFPALLISPGSSDRNVQFGVSNRQKNSRLFVRGERCDSLVQVLFYVAELPRQFFGGAARFQNLGGFATIFVVADTQSVSKHYDCDEDERVNADYEFRMSICQNRVSFSWFLDGRISNFS
jgi:hypothetical protein